MKKICQTCGTILDTLSEISGWFRRLFGGSFYTTRKERRELKDTIRKAKKEGKWVCIGGRRY